MLSVWAIGRRRKAGRRVQFWRDWWVIGRGARRGRDRVAWNLEGGDRFLRRLRGGRFGRVSRLGNRLCLAVSIGG